MAQSPLRRVAELSKRVSKVCFARRNDRRASKALIQWLNDVEALMRISEDDLISWLRDVQDFNYPRALYAAAVSSVDAQVGALVAHPGRRSRLIDEHPAR